MSPRFAMFFLSMRTSGPGRDLNTNLFRAFLFLRKNAKLTRASDESCWLRGLDSNQRPPGYGPDELPGCSTPLQGIVSVEERASYVKRKQNTWS